MMESIKILEKSGYDDVVIVFSARKQDKGKFTFYKQVIDFPASIIFVNDYGTEWYLKGTSDFQCSIEFINYLNAEVHKLTQGRGKVFTFGSSMGAYAALVYGSILQVDKILAFGPEVELCIPLGRSIESLKNKFSEGACNIANLHYKHPDNVLIISGNNDIPDLYSATIFKESNSKIDVKLINNYTHVVAKYIQEKIPIKDFVLQYFFGSYENLFKTFNLASLVTKEQAISIKKFNEAFTINKRILLSEKENILQVATLQKNWSMPQYYMALIYEKENNIDLSIQYLVNSLSAQKNLNRARFKLVQLYLKSNLLDKALEEATILKGYNFTYSVAMLLAEIYLKREDISSYKEVLVEIRKASTLKEKELESIDRKLLEVG